MKLLQAFQPQHKNLSSALPANIWGNSGKGVSPIGYFLPECLDDDIRDQSEMGEGALGRAMQSDILESNIESFPEANSAYFFQPPGIPRPPGLSSGRGLTPISSNPGGPEYPGMPAFVP